MKTRIVSSIIMLLGVGSLLYIGGLYWVIFIAILSLIATWELIKTREIKKEFPIIMKLITYLLTLILVIANTLSGTINLSLNYSIMASFFLLFLMPLVFINDNERYNINDAFYLIGIVLFSGLSFSLAITFRSLDIVYILYIALITIMTDTFAYFTGILIGKHKLCEKISPKKTVEGLVGGTIMGTIIPSLYYLVVINIDAKIFVVVLVTFILSLIGQCGDLMFSSIKRYYGKKDFSDIIPGHGGILDRMDSIIFVILAFSIVMKLL